MEGPSPRIVKETKTIQSDPVPGIAFKPDPNNYKHFFIELQGTSSSIQAHQELATKTANLKQSFFFLMTTPCRHPRLSSTPRSTTPTSVHANLCRQFRTHLSRYSQKELVTCSPNEVSLALHPKFDGRAQPRRPS